MEMLKTGNISRKLYSWWVPGGSKFPPQSKQRTFNRKKYPLILSTVGKSLGHCQKPLQKTQ
jgi:hypothetical protein